MINPDIFVYTATILNVVMLFPQVIRTWKSKQTKDLSLLTLVMFLTACTLWVLYGISKNALPIILANTTVGTMNGILIFCKLRYPNSSRNAR